MKCPCCGSRKKTKIKKEMYPFRVFELTVYTVKCGKCGMNWLPIKEEKKLDKKLKFYRRKHGVE